MEDNFVSLDDNVLEKVCGASAAGVAVGAAMSQLGTPYVWGGSHPGGFDCSGLVNWAYGRAGVHLGRTTGQLIHEGHAVSRSQVQPGDLVFPSSHHVQIALGGGRVIEAPHTGANVRVSTMGSHVQIRRVA